MHISEDLTALSAELEEEYGILNRTPKSEFLPSSSERETAAVYAFLEAPSPQDSRGT